MIHDPSKPVGAEGRLSRSRPPSPRTALPLLAIVALLLATPVRGGVEPPPTAGVDPSSPVQQSTAVAAATEPDEALALIRGEITRLLSTGAGRSGNWGVLAVSLDRGDTLFALGAQEPLAPASNLKLFTTAGALHHFGPDYRFQTFLLADGKVQDGVLEGDLILYGTGDPSISGRLLRSEEEPFRAFAQALRDRGVHTVRGDVLADGSFFSGPRRRPSWNPRDLNDWFAAPVSAIAFNENMVTLQVGAGAPGEAPRVRWEPEGALLPVENRARTVAGAPGQGLIVVRDDPDDPIELRGQIGARQVDVRRRLTVSEPELFAAAVLARVLQDEGIRVTGVPGHVLDREASRVTGRTIVAPGLAGAEGPGPWTVAVHRSPPMSRLLGVVNRVSHNLFSDQILLAMGRQVEGEGSFDAGGRVLTRYLVEVAGIPAEGLHIEDGSGLSRLNRAPPAAFVTLLAHMSAGENAETFWASLPEAGNQRELRRMYRSPAAGNLRAKTGTISRVSALSGIVRGTNGEPILFSIIANNVPSTWAAKDLEDRIGIRLASFDRAPLLVGDQDED